MGASEKAELYFVKKDLNKVIIEMDDIATSIKGDFEGIGEDKCANCVQSINSTFQRIKQKMNYIDTSE